MSALWGFPDFAVWLWSRRERSTREKGSVEVPWTEAWAGQGQKVQRLPALCPEREAEGTVFWN